MSELHLEHPRLLWLLAVLLPLLGLALVRSRADMRRGGQVAALVLRGLWIVLCLVAVSGPVLTRKQAQSSSLKVIVLDDHSQSVASGRQEVERSKQALIQALDRRSQLLELRFAGKAWRPDQSAVETDQTDIEAALSAANFQGMDAADCRVILFSDGRATRGDSIAAAQRLALRGAVVHTVPVGRRQSQEPRIVQIDPPVEARKGAPAAFRVTVASEQPVRGALRLIQPDGTVADQRTLPIAGQKTLVLRCTPKDQGVLMYSVELVVQREAEGLGDERIGEPANRRTGERVGSASADASAPPIENRKSKIENSLDPLPAPSSAAQRVSVYVEGPPRLLVVDSFPDELDALRRALEPLGLPIDLVRPEALPADLSAYAAIVLSDLSGRELSDVERAALRKYVEELGGGLLFIGGGNVLASRWKLNPLAELLPLKIEERPVEVVKPPTDAAVCFVLDRSGSMGSPLPVQGGQRISKLDLVKAATIASLQAMPANAQVAVVAFDGTPDTVVPPTPIANRNQIARQVDSIGGGGGTSIAPAVREGLRQLGAMKGEKYLIVLTDGRGERTASDQPYWDALLAEAQGAGVAWTSIAVGQGADTQLLEYLANQMAGRYFFCETGDQVPKVFLQQARDIQRIVKSKPTDFAPRPGPAAGKLRDVVVADMPQLHGRLHTKPREQAEVMLLSEASDPLLASWQFGLGRVVAFGSDAKAAWAKDWTSWKGFSLFWIQMVQGVMRTNPALHVKVRSQVQGRSASFVYSISDDAGRPVSDLTSKGTLSSADAPAAVLADASVQWKQLAPGTYQANVQIPLENRQYLVSMSLQKNSSRPVHYCALVSTSPTGELAQTGPDRPALQAIAEAGGGQCWDDPAALAGACRPGEERVVLHATPLWPALIILALLLWPVDLAIRKFL